jgi:hypothetical protein
MIEGRPRMNRNIATQMPIMAKIGTAATVDVSFDHGPAENPASPAKPPNRISTTRPAAAPRHPMMMFKIPRILT